MTPAWLSVVPGWLLLGLGLGGTLALLVAAVFVVGSRRFPSDTRPTEGRSTGDRKRRAEIRDYLRRIDEPFVEDDRIAGRRVAFHLPDRGVAITFDAKTYYALERAGLTAVLVEHELPGWQLGTRLPFETPAISRERREGRTAFAVLGLPPDASTEEVRAAYREQVKAVHPDHGGDRESFERIREAYTVAKERAG